MSTAKIFQRFSQGPAIAMAGLLTLSSMLPFGNATAQEPAIKPSTPAAATLAAHHVTKPAFTRATSEFGSAGQHAEKMNEVAFWIILPEGGRYTPEKAGEILVAQMAQRGVPAHAFGTNSPKDGGMGVTVFIPKNGLYQNPMTGTTDFDLRSIIPQLNIIAEQYLKSQSSDRVATNKIGPESTP
ncbi:MAG: hypothetical protein IPJ01_06035 [Micavibrio sp.]|jgi:hypothetical protein|nr:hypothetical protein [Micavibrio sp.]MBK9562691.1 hypothetical protein [Micavibrio sp.]